MEVYLSYRDLQFLQIACQIAIKELRIDQKIAGERSPMSTAYLIQILQDLESKLEEKILSY